MRGTGSVQAGGAALLILVLLVAGACGTEAQTPPPQPSATLPQATATAPPTTRPPLPTLIPSATPSLTATADQDQNAAVSVELQSLDAGAMLVITNHTAVPIYHEVLRQELLPLIEWVPCSQPDRCPEAQIPPVQSVRYALAEMVEADTEGLMVFWWRLEPAGEDQYAVADFTGVEVPLDR